MPAALLYGEPALLTEEPRRRPAGPLYRPRSCPSAQGRRRRPHPLVAGAGVGRVRSAGREGSSPRQPWHHDHSRCRHNDCDCAARPLEIGGQVGEARRRPIQTILYYYKII